MLGCWYQNVLISIGVVGSSFRFLIVISIFWFLWHFWLLEWMSEVSDCCENMFSVSAWVLPVFSLIVILLWLNIVSGFSNFCRNFPIVGTIEFSDCCMLPGFWKFLPQQHCCQNCLTVKLLSEFSDNYQNFPMIIRIFRWSSEFSDGHQNFPLIIRIFR